MSFKEWKTRDGKKIKIKKMENSHLNNSIAMMERNGFVTTDTWERMCIPPQMNGDMAQYYAEQEWSIWISKHRPSSLLDSLKKERIRRGGYLG